MTRLYQINVTGTFQDTKYATWPIVVENCLKHFIQFHNFILKQVLNYICAKCGAGQMAMIIWSPSICKHNLIINVLRVQESVDIRDSKMSHPRNKMSPACLCSHHSPKPSLHRIMLEEDQLWRAVHGRHVIHGGHVRATKRGARTPSEPSCTLGDAGPSQHRDSLESRPWARTVLFPNEPACSQSPWGVTKCNVGSLPFHLSLKFSLFPQNKKPGVRS